MVFSVWQLADSIGPQMGAPNSIFAFENCLLFLDCHCFLGEKLDEMRLLRGCLALLGSFLQGEHDQQ